MKRSFLIDAVQLLEYSSKTKTFAFCSKPLQFCMKCIEDDNCEEEEEKLGARKTVSKPSIAWRITAMRGLALVICMRMVEAV